MVDFQVRKSAWEIQHGKKDEPPTTTDDLDKLYAGIGKMNGYGPPTL